MCFSLREHQMNAALKSFPFSDCATMVYNHTVAFLFDHQQTFKFIAETSPDKEGFYRFNHNQFISIWAIQRENA